MPKRDKSDPRDSKKDRKTSNEDESSTSKFRSLTEQRWNKVKEKKKKICSNSSRFGSEKKGKLENYVQTMRRWKRNQVLDM